MRFPTDFFFNFSRWENLLKRVVSDFYSGSIFLILFPLSFNLSKDPFTILSNFAWIVILYLLLTGWHLPSNTNFINFQNEGEKMVEGIDEIRLAKLIFKAN